MKSLLTSLLVLFGFAAMGAVPSYTSFRGSGGILVSSNPPTGTIVIDGSGVSAHGTNSTIGVNINGTNVILTATNINFIQGQNIVLFGTNINSTAHVVIQGSSNLFAATNLYVTNQCFVYSQGNTNNIIVTGASSPLANGTYKWAGTRWTNANSATHNISYVVADTFYAISNATQMLYENNTGTPVGGTPAWDIISGAGPNPPTAVYMDATNCFDFIGFQKPPEINPTSTNLYVSMSGNDTNAIRGRIDRPWRNLFAAMANATAGDCIEIGPGNFPTDNSQMFRAINFELQDIRVHGAGAGITTLGTAGGQEEQWFVGRNTVIEGLTMNGYLWIGSAGNAKATNVLIQNCVINGQADSIYLDNWSDVRVFNCHLISGYDNIADWDQTTTNATNRTIKVIGSLLESDGANINPCRNVFGGQSRYEFYGCKLSAKNGSSIHTNACIFFDTVAGTQTNVTGSLYIAGCYLEHSTTNGQPTYAIANFIRPPLLTIVGPTVNTNEVYRPDALNFIGTYCPSCSGGAGGGPFNITQFSPGSGSYTSIIDGVVITNAVDYTSFKVIVGTGNAATNMIAASTTTTFFPQTAATGTFRVGDNSGSNNARYLVFNKGTAKLTMGNGQLQSFDHTVSTGATTNSGAFDNAGVTRLFGTTTNYNVVNVKSNLFVDQTVYLMDRDDGSTYYGALYANNPASPDPVVNLDSDTAAGLSFNIGGVRRAILSANQFQVKTNFRASGGVQLDGPYINAAAGRPLVSYNASGDTMFTNTLPGIAQPPSSVLSNLVFAGGAYTNIAENFTNAAHHGLISTNSNFKAAWKTISAGANITITNEGLTNILITAAGGGSGSPGGADLNVQVNQAGVFGGNNRFVFNYNDGNVYHQGGAFSNRFMFPTPLMTDNMNVLANPATWTNAIVILFSNVVDSIPTGLIPDARTVPGCQIWIHDMLGTCGGTNLQFSMSIPGQTINFGTTFKLDSAFQSVIFYSDGANWHAF